MDKFQAPKNSFAVAAAINVVWTIIPAHRNRLRVAAYHLYRRSFDDRIENKCAACVPLTIRAMAAVHTDRLSQQFVAHLAARTAASGSLAFALRSRFHVFPIHVCAATLCDSSQNGGAGSVPHRPTQHVFS